MAPAAKFATNGRAGPNATVKTTEHHLSIQSVPQTASHVRLTSLVEVAMGVLTKGCLICTEDLDVVYKAANPRKVQGGEGERVGSAIEGNTLPPE